MTEAESLLIDKKIGFIKQTIKGLQHYDSPYKLVDEIDKWLCELSFFLIL